MQDISTPNSPVKKKQKMSSSDNGSASSSYDYDLVVVGGGSGGMNAAKAAMKANPSIKVAMFDYVKPSPAGTSWGLGGTCVNVGCIPKKLMHYTGLLGHSLGAAEELGWAIKETEVTHSWEKMAETVQNYIGSLNWSYKKSMKAAGVKYIHAYASFVDEHTLEYVERKQTKRLTAKFVLIATGGRPNYGNYPGKELCISSDDLFWLKKSPGKTLCVGGGYISLECANFLHETKQGEVTVMVRSRPMRQFDSQVGAQIGELMERDGVRFLFPCDIVSITAKNRPNTAGAGPLSEGPHQGQIPLPQDPKGKTSRWLHPNGTIEVLTHRTGVTSYTRAEGPLVVTYRNKLTGQEHKEEFDTVLLAIARIPNIKGFGLEKTGVEVAWGKIVVDESERTSVPNIYAIGDVATGIKSHGYRVGTPVVVNGSINGVISHDHGGGVFDISSSSPTPSSPSPLSKVPQAKLTYQTKHRPELTPVAIQAGELLVRRLFGSKKDNAKLMDYSLICTTVFTTPEYGVVGLSTEEAERSEAEGGIGKENVQVYHSRYGPIEDTPLHPHVKQTRSKLLHGKHLWAKRYADERGLYWADTGFDEDDYCHVLYNDGKTHTDALATVTSVVTSEGKVSYTIKLKDDETIIEGVAPSSLEPEGESYKFRAERYLKAPCLAKLIVDKRDNRVVGLHFLGPNAGEVTQGFGLALKLGAKKEDFDELVGIHPTAAEEFAVLELTRGSGISFLKKEGCGGGSC
jgi:thioredoxin reductase (NADPH)